MDREELARRPVVAGSFYPGTASAVEREIEECFSSPLGPGRMPTVAEEGPRKVLGAVAAHAGYVYSGPQAARTYLALAEDGVPDVAVVMGPNHSGMGRPVAVWPRGSWATPLGQMQVDAELAEAIIASAGGFEADTLAHTREHSIEVQLPFLQYVYQRRPPKLVPICLGVNGERRPIEIGKALGEVLKGRNAILIASTDFTHYESRERAKEKDGAALSRIASLDAPGLLRTVAERRISMCGVVPTAAMLAACQVLGATRAEVLGYSTSGDITGDSSQVVGYGSAIVLR